MTLQTLTPYHAKYYADELLSRCEWGRDDYSLEVANLGPAPPEPGQQGLDFAD